MSPYPAVRSDSRASETPSGIVTSSTDAGGPGLPACRRDSMMTPSRSRNVAVRCTTLDSFLEARPECGCPSPLFGLNPCCLGADVVEPLLHDRRAKLPGRDGILEHVTQVERARRAMRKELVAQQQHAVVDVRV